MTDQIINLPDLDKNAFEIIDLPTLKTARRVKIYDSTVEVIPSGLRTAFKCTTQTISTTAQALPTIPLDKRNSIVIYNASTEILYIGNADVTADFIEGTTSGWQVDPKSYFPTDITTDVVLYGIFASGSHKIQILEIA